MLRVLVLAHPVRLFSLTHVSEHMLGRYGATPVMLNSSCTAVCPPGYYCPAGSTTPTSLICPAGVFGGSGASSALCSGPCPAGYYCPQQTTAPGMQHPCPPGKTENCRKRLVVDESCAGTYSTGGYVSLAQCSPCDWSMYCPFWAATNGSVFDCPPGFAHRLSGADVVCVFQSLWPGRIVECKLHRAVSKGYGGCWPLFLTVSLARELRIFLQQYFQ